MRFPQLNVIPAAEQTVDAFRGYNHNPRTGPGEFYDMENLTSDHYPLLSPRGRRALHCKTASPQGLIAMDALCYVDGSDFVAGTQRVPMALSTAAADCPKQLVSMGAYVVILPDKKYVNTRELSDFGDIEAEFTGSVTVEAAEEGYVRLSAAGIGRDFRAHDGIAIGGLEELSSAVVKEREEDWLTVAGSAPSQTAQLTLRRAMPKLDFVTESGNRLWGCRYGPDEKGSFVNEIYASAPGDFRNWSRFEGLSTDSYTASCGDSGPFTGAVTYLGMPLFFKENCIYKVYGSYPAAYRIQQTACRGVQEGCGRSLAIVDETLFYKSRGGICAYDGSLPVCVSEQLGKDTYTAAAGGACGGKYYVSLGDGARHQLFVFDTARSLWHREDGLHVSAFCTHKGILYGIDDGTFDILLLTGDRGDERVRWMAETGQLLLGSLRGKRISRMKVRLCLEKGAKAEFFARYDGFGGWEPLGTVFGTALRVFTVPLRPRKCDTLQLRIRGEGMGKVYALTTYIRENAGG